MKYSYEFKKECVQLYRLRKWADTPEGIRDKQFHDMIIIQSKLENLHGPEVLKRNSNRVWITDEKLELISKIMAGKSVRSIAVDEYIDYYKNERIQEKTKWMPPVKYKEASMA